jgi:hypothetical protein
MSKVKGNILGVSHWKLVNLALRLSADNRIKGDDKFESPSTYFHQSITKVYQAVGVQTDDDLLSENKDIGVHANAIPSGDRP